MLGFIKKLLGKIAFSELRRNAVLDIDTVTKLSPVTKTLEKFIRARVELFDKIIFDRLIPVGFDTNIDIRIGGNDE